MEICLAMVTTNLYSSLNVEHMQSRVLKGSLWGKQLDTRAIKCKLGFTWGSDIKNPFYLDHFEHCWYAIEFIDEEKLELSWTIGHGMLS